jgi:ComF family protein
LSDIEVDFPVYSLSSYNQKIAEVIRIIKYRPSKRLLKQFSELIRPLVKESAKKLKFDILIPVPMHKKREGLRGFNQAAVFAEIMANSLGASFSPALCRKINTRPQADCDANERKINLVNSIELASGLIKGAFAGKRICLVDDVATTGATLQICKEALLELNPAAIEALVVSHSFMRNEKHSSSNLKG